MSFLNLLQHLNHYDASSIELTCGVTVKDTFYEAGVKIAKKINELELENRQLREQLNES